MSNYKLSFGEITIIQDDIAEVIVNDGVEFDLKMVNEYHGFLLKNMKSPFSLLINKLNSYTYTFEAQRELASLYQINAMSVIVYNKIAEASTKSLSTLPREMPWKIKIFHDYQAGLRWLQKEQLPAAESMLLEVNK